VGDAVLTQVLQKAFDINVTKIEADVNSKRDEVIQVSKRAGRLLCWCRFAFL
jgi:hypothetical protein